MWATKSALTLGMHGFAQRILFNSHSLCRICFYSGTQVFIGWRVMPQAACFSVRLRLPAGHTLEWVATVQSIRKVNMPGLCPGPSGIRGLCGSFGEPFRVLSRSPFGAVGGATWFTGDVVSAAQCQWGTLGLLTGRLRQPPRPRCPVAARVPVSGPRPAAELSVRILSGPPPPGGLPVPAPWWRCTPRWRGLSS